MKYLMMILVSLNIVAGEIEGVTFSCDQKAEKRMERYKKHSMVSACKDRKKSNLEHFTFCDGSGCTGFTANTLKSCQFTDWWDGQDDQDPIDPIEWKESCLTADDFKSAKIETDLKSMKIGDSMGVSGSSVYQLLGKTENRSDFEVAEAVGKQIRRDYYLKSYQIDAYDYKEISIEKAALKLKTSEGEFKALSKNEIAKIDKWFEDHSVKKIIMMNLETNYMSGTGLEQNFIYIPTERYEPVLVINRFYYAE